MHELKTESGKNTKEIEVFNPATEEKLGSVPYSTTEDVLKAIEAADKNFKRWKTPSSEK